MRIWIDAGGAAGNPGDEAATACGIARARRVWPDAELVVAANPHAPVPGLGDAEEPMQAGLLQRIQAPATLLRDVEAGLGRRPWVAAMARLSLGSRWRRRLSDAIVRHPSPMPESMRLAAEAIGEAIAACDLYFAVGAANLHDAAIDAAIHPRLWTMQRFLRRNRPCLLSGQSVGPLHQDHAAALVRQIVDHAGLIGLRDEHRSLEWIEAIGADPAATRVTGDDVFDLPPAPPEDVDRYLDAAGLAGQPFCLMQVRDRDGAGAVAPESPTICAAAAELASHARVLLLPVAGGERSGDDARFATRVREACLRSGGVSRDAMRVGPLVQSAALLRGLAGRAEAVLAWSHLLQVFALAAHTPLCALISGAYDAFKTDALLDWLEPGARRRVRLDAPDDESDHTASTLAAWLRDAGDQARAIRVAGERIRERQRAFERELRERFGAGGEPDRSCAA